MAPTMVVRVAGNVEDLKRAMQDGEKTVQATTGKILQFTGATEKAVPAGKQVAAAYREFDGVLQSLGINVGPYVKGLEDIATLATGGAKSLGFFAFAAAAVGTALASWKIGEHIGKVTGWTKAIADGTAVLMGWGDVQKQEMLARMQSSELFGHAVAMWKLQAEGTAAATQATAAHTAETQRASQAALSNATHMQNLEVQLGAAKKKREEDNRAKAAAWPVIEGATERTNALSAALERQAQSLKETMAREAERRAQINAFMNAPTLNNNPVESWGFSVTSLSQSELAQTNERFDPFGQGGNTGLLARLRQLEALEGTYAPRSADQYSQMLSDILELARLRMTAHNLGIPGYGMGGRNVPGGPAIVGEHGPELVNLPRGADVIPNHRMGGVIISPTIVIKGTAIGSSLEFQQAVEQAILNVLRSGGHALPAMV